MKIIKIGTRDSMLALWQAEWVKSKLSAVYPDTEFMLVPMKTKGDIILDVPLAKIGDKGLFTKELEIGLLNSEIDLAVHSLKDLPTQLPVGLTIAAYCVREEPRDVFISKNRIALADLPAGSLIGTSSLRRKAQLLCYRPDLSFSDLRGNLQTRWRKMQESDMSGIVLAAAGVKRLGWEDRITEILPETVMLSAVGQGSIAIEVAADRADILALVRVLNHSETEKAVCAERVLMRRLEGGCQIPLGGFATVVEGSISLQGMVASLDGKRILRASAVAATAEEAGTLVAEGLIAQGAWDILNEIRLSVE